MTKPNDKILRISAIIMWLEKRRKAIVDAFKSGSCIVALDKTEKGLLMDCSSDIEKVINETIQLLSKTMSTEEESIKSRHIL